MRKSRIGSFIIIVLLITVLVVVYNIFLNKDFNGFLRYELMSDTTEFYRDNDIKYSKYRSYAISSPDYNSATIGKTIEVLPNTPYKVTAMVRTENVESDGKLAASGAGICILDTSESSRMLTGSNDWTKVEMLFDSKNRTSVEIGFRLGGFSDKCMGKAWFSDFTLEYGSKTQSSNWNIGCFIFEQTDLSAEATGGSAFKVKMDRSDISTLNSNIRRFENTMSELSGGKINVKCETKIIAESLTSISYDPENGHFVNYTDVQDILEKYIGNNVYDHIYVFVRLGDKLSERAVSGLDWIGLGGMDYYGIGYSNIRLPNDRNSVIYDYDTRYNTFPEEVLVHEILHTFERNMKEYGYEVPNLHDNALYGYEMEKIVGLQEWYRDYMQCKILDKTTGEYVGIKEEIFSQKPANRTDLEFSVEKEINKEPNNPVERIITLIKTLVEYNKKK